MVEKFLCEGRHGAAHLRGLANGVNLAGAEEEQGNAGDIVFAEIMHQPAAAGDEEDLEEIMEMRDEPLRLLRDGKLQRHDHAALRTQAVIEWKDDGFKQMYEKRIADKAKDPAATPAAPGAPAAKSK